MTMAVCDLEIIAIGLFCFEDHPSSFQEMVSYTNTAVIEKLAGVIAERWLLITLHEFGAEGVPIVRSSTLILRWYD